MMELFTGRGEKIEKVDLPHDAMICQERDPDTKNAHQTGFYPGGEYTYLKKWNVPEEWRDHKIVLEFEGIADTCRIYCNGDLVAEHYNPYTSIFVDVTGYLKWGQENELKVEVRSVEQSSRWYSGAGLCMRGREDRSISRRRACISAQRKQTGKRHRWKWNSRYAAAAWIPDRSGQW